MNLELNDQQINYVLQTLAARPFAEVAELFGHIQRQMAQQHGQRPQVVGAEPQRVGQS